MSFFHKACNFPLIFGCSKTPTDVSEDIRVMFAYSSVTGHNYILEIRIRNKIMLFS